MRKVVAIAAAPGLIAGIYIFIASFFGLMMDKLGAKAILLHIGIFALFIPLVIVERWSKGGDPFRGKPRWVVRSMQMLFLLFVTVFLAFLALSHAASSEIVNGEYVLNSHGKIVAYISERDYLALKGWELRLFASGWMVFYYALTMYWCSVWRLSLYSKCCPQGNSASDGVLRADMRLKLAIALPFVGVFHFVNRIAFGES